MTAGCERVGETEVHAVPDLVVVCLAHLAGHVNQHLVATGGEYGVPLPAGWLALAIAVLPLEPVPLFEARRRELPPHRDVRRAGPGLAVPPLLQEKWMPRASCLVGREKRCTGADGCASREVAEMQHICVEGAGRGGAPVWMECGCRRTSFSFIPPFSSK